MRLKELAAALDMPERQVRYMIGEGILPGTVERGRNADGFGETHLKLGRRYLSLRSEGMSAHEVKRMMAAERSVVLYGVSPLTFVVDAHADLSSLDVEAVLSDIADALRNHVSRNTQE